MACPNCGRDARVDTLTDLMVHLIGLLEAEARIVSSGENLGEKVDK